MDSMDASTSAQASLDSRMSSEVSSDTSTSEEDSHGAKVCSQTSSIASTSDPVSQDSNTSEHSYASTPRVASSEAGPSKPVAKPKHKILPVIRKLEIIDKLDNGLTIDQICSEYGISIRSVLDIKHSKARLKSCAIRFGITKDNVRKLEPTTTPEDPEDQKSPDSKMKLDATKILKQMKFPENTNLDKALNKYVMLLKATGIKTKTSFLRVAAQHFAETMEVKGFVATRSWVKKFRRNQSFKAKDRKCPALDSSKQPISNIETLNLETTTEEIPSTSAVKEREPLYMNTGSVEKAEILQIASKIHGPIEDPEILQKMSKSSGPFESSEIHQESSPKKVPIEVSKIPLTPSKSSGSIVCSIIQKNSKSSDPVKDSNIHLESSKNYSPVKDSNIHLESSKNYSPVKDSNIHLKLSKNYSRVEDSIIHLEAFKNYPHVEVLKIIKTPSKKPGSVECSNIPQKKPKLSVSIKKAPKTVAKAKRNSPIKFVGRPAMKGVPKKVLVTHSINAPRHRKPYFSGVGTNLPVQQRPLQGAREAPLLLQEVSSEVAEEAPTLKQYPLEGKRVVVQSFTDFLVKDREAQSLYQVPIERFSAAQSTLPQVILEEPREVEFLHQDTVKDATKNPALQQDTLEEFMVAGEVEVEETEETERQQSDLSDGDGYTDEMADTAFCNYIYQELRRIRGEERKKWLKLRVITEIFKTQHFH